MTIQPNRATETIERELDAGRFHLLETRPESGEFQRAAR
jgi:hypothetical protein